jgi:peptidoglycan L-alanyl-D-glutamate endopeptidase CwlK
VRAFQEANGLGVDGQVGPNTMAALQAASAGDAASGGGTFDAAEAGMGAATATATSPLPNITPQLVSKMFPGTKVANIAANLPIVLQALVDAGLGDKDMVLMALGTIRAETASFEPISEGISKFNTTGTSHPFDKYDFRKSDLGNQGPPDGANFKGRGFVQLTGRSNYKVHGAAIGLGNQLVDNPSLANDPQIAAKLLASFLKSKEQKIRNALAAKDLATARKAVNGGSHGLAEFHRRIQHGRQAHRIATK